MKPGTVYIVGAGPGDPELITLKGKRVLEEAQVVIYDRLVGNDILNYINPEAESIYVGKEDSFHTIPQEEINRLIVNKAKSRKRVVRLKGGDPYIFGRGAEEAEALFKEGIPFEVVPGITAASGAAAYAGIPLTDRRYTSAVTFITGHKRAGENLNFINWNALAKIGHTIVFYMTIRNLPVIVNNLIKNGMDRETPAAVVRCATMSNQETVSGTVENINEELEKSGIRPPALLVIGNVLNLRDRLNWFEHE